MEGVRNWWQELAGLVLPAECGGCGRAREVLCPECRAVLGGTAPFRVRPVPEPPGLPAVHAAARYADEVRAVLLAHKERGVLALTRPLGVALAGAVRVGVGVGVGPPPPGDILLVPVPSTPATTRSRGHDPARRIALVAAGELRRAGLAVRVAAVLRQRRAVADQAGLSARERLENLVGALTVVPGGARVLGGGPVVLVDDLVTTGASLAEAARAVRAARTTAPETPAPTRRPQRTPRGEEARTAPERVPRAGRTTARGAPERVSRAGRMGRVECGEGGRAVYAGVTREGREVRPSGAGAGRGGGGVCEAGEVLCAAVVAAPPDSFEINRN
ncbi:ComF family protein [Streptomyces sp. Amel2xC10]|uniref:ComF family protein n=1 Tax=Streptomyces sp. Amel2xC10 TaxID=1305826 RepID=UPI000A08EA67|nr:ComF family protein [Streptomyces sp. Amel2xC10]SMF09232.1 Predicted amidophosphoribosyltransferases [Streptomyces sp. Amel2xC10]